MPSRKCICNGSRGTDCDYCGGKEWIASPRNIIQGSRKSVVKRNEPPTQKPIYQKVNVEKAVVLPQPTKPITNRIKVLFGQVHLTNKNASAQVIVSLGSAIKELHFDIKALKRKIRTKAHQKEYDKLIEKSTELIYSFDTKFKDYKLLE